MSDPGGDCRRSLAATVAGIESEPDEANRAREQALPACRRAIRAAGSSIRAVHRLDDIASAALAAEAEAAVREAHGDLVPFPAVGHAGFLHDAEKEYVEARCVAALVAGGPLPGPDALAVSPTARLRGLAAAASVLRRQLRARLREADLARGAGPP